MRKIIFLFAIIPNLINAQFFNFCDCNIDYGLQPYHSGSTSMDFNNEEPLVVKTYFLVEEQTEIDEGINETNYLEAIAYLNINYNQFNIFFKYIGFEYVDDIDDYDSNYYPDRINFRVRPNTGGAVAGFPDPLNILITYQAFTNDENKKFLIVHEVGHILGLAHVNGSTANTPGIFLSPLSCNSEQITEGAFPSFNGNSDENVTRDSSNPNYNANTAGDFVVDTPASYYEPNLCVDTSSGTPIL